MKNLIKNFFRSLIARENTKNQLQIGSSHFSLARQNYKKYENLYEADFKVFSGFFAASYSTSLATKPVEKRPINKVPIIKPRNLSIYT